MVISDVRKAVRLTRKRVGLTQAEVAKLAKVGSVARFASFEAGYAKLKSEELDRVIKVLNRAERKRMVPLASLACAVPDSPEARRDYRVHAGLTQQELARRSGLFQDLISKFELGKKDLSPEQARRWRDAVEAATKEVEAREFADAATRCLSGFSVEGAENARLRAEVLNLREIVENLKRQLKNAETIAVNQEEISALQHYTIEQLKEHFGEEATEVVNELT